MVRNILVLQCTEADSGPLLLSCYFWILSGFISDASLAVLLISEITICSVVDPYSFFTDPDPDPEFDVGDQYGSGSNTDPGL